MTGKDSSQLIYMMAAAGSALFMGTIGTISAYSGLGSETVTFFRLFLGCLFMTLFLVFRKDWKLIRISFSLPLVLSGLCLAGFIVTYIQSMKYTSMANAIVTIYLAPLVASLAAHFLFGEKLNSYSFSLICLSLAGFLIMKNGSGSEAGSSGSHPVLGISLALGAMLLYAMYIIVNRVIPAGIHVYTRTWNQFFYGALLMLPFSIIYRAALTPVQAGWLIMAGLVPGFFAILLAVIALNRLPASVFGTFAYLEPITVIVLGWVLFGENLGLLQMAGGALILAAGIIRAFMPVSPQQSGKSPLSEGAEGACS